MEKIKFDVSKYKVVIEKVSGRHFAVLEADTPVGEWDNLLEEDIDCIPVSKEGELELEEILKKPIKRNELDTNVWIESYSR